MQKPTAPDDLPNGQNDAAVSSTSTPSEIDQRLDDDAKSRMVWEGGPAPADDESE